MAPANHPDVIVVGAGLAGLSAANRAAQDGLAVTVLEKSTDEAYLCNSRYTGGLFHIAMDDMAGDPAWVKSNLERTTRGTTDPRLAEALTQNARRTLRWLSSLGVRFIQAGPDGLRRNSLAPPGVRQTGLNWKGRAGDVMLRTLGERLQSRGGRILRGMAAQRLLMEGGRCLGVEARTPAGGTTQLHSAAVVIAVSGTFGQILSYVVSVDLIFLGLTGAALFVFRRRSPEQHVAFRAPYHPFTTGLFVAACAIVVIATVWNNPLNSFIGYAILLAGVPACLYWQRKMAREAS